MEKGRWDLRLEMFTMDAYSDYGLLGCDIVWPYLYILRLQQENAF